MKGLFCPDQTDQLIIDRLRRENTANSILARELGISEGTVRQRLKRLREEGVLRVTAGIDPDALENQQVALIAVKVTESALLETKAQELSRLERVLSVSIVSGRYDLMVEVLVGTNRGLVEFITGDLARVEGVATTESFLLLKSYGKFV